MAHWDHMCGMADDFAMAKLTLSDGESAGRYRRRRIIAVAFVPAFLLLMYLLAVFGNQAVVGTY